MIQVDPNRTSPRVVCALSKHYILRALLVSVEREVSSLLASCCCTRRVCKKAGFIETLHNPLESCLPANTVLACRAAYRQTEGDHQGAADRVTRGVRHAEERVLLGLQALACTTCRGEGLGASVLWHNPLLDACLPLMTETAPNACSSATDPLQVPTEPTRILPPAP